MLSRQILCARNFTYSFQSAYRRKTDLLAITFLNNEYSRSNSTKSSNSKKTLPIFLGLSVGAGAIATYLWQRQSTSPKTKEDEEEIPFSHKHLDEDLSLLKEFGPIPYLLIGAGSASYTAYRAIRTRDPTAKVLMIGNEPFYPYMRPPLSKEMWFETKNNVDEFSFTQWDGKNRSIFYEPDAYYFSIKELLDNKNGGISVIRRKTVKKIDPSAQVVYLDKGEKISYLKCLIAPGSVPNNIPVFENADDSVKKHISVFRNIKDFQKLHKISQKVKSIVIVGGGFLGSELAYGLARNASAYKYKVTQVYPELGNIGQVLPEYLSKWTMKKIEEEGVRILPNATVKAVHKEENHIVLELSNNKRIIADHVIVAVGAKANTDLAKSSGLETDKEHGGFLVNTEMEARHNLWVAGDASCFYDTNLGRRRVEHYDHAIVSGRLAGENMTGNPKAYWHQSMFWSDLGPNIAFEGIGICDSSLPSIGVFLKPDVKKVVESDAKSTEALIGLSNKTVSTNDNENITKSASQNLSNSSDEYNKGVLFYMKDNIIVGIILWNVFGKMHVARQIINEAKTYDDIKEVAKLFEMTVSDIVVNQD